MTGADILIYFRELYNLSSHTNDKKGDDEIDVYLNLAQDEIIEEQLEEVEGVIPLRKIKNSIKSYNILSGLLSTSSSLSGLASDNEFSDNGYTATIPSSIRYIISGRCQVTKTTTNPLQAWYPATPINPVDIDKYVNTPSNKPVIINPVFTFSGGKLLIFIDSSDASLDDMKVDYIADPTAISSGAVTELPDSVHKELIQKAVNIALKSSSIEPTQKVSFDIQEDMQ